MEMKFILLKSIKHHTGVICFKNNTFYIISNGIFYFLALNKKSVEVLYHVIYKVSVENKKEDSMR